MLLPPRLEEPFKWGAGGGGIPPLALGLDLSEWNEDQPGRGRMAKYTSCMSWTSYGTPGEEVGMDGEEFTRDSFCLL